MVSKKKRFADDEIPVFNDGCIYKRGDYWHFRLWLRDENKYARKSLNTTNRSTAIERGEAFYLELRANQQIGKKYFSLTAKEGVRLYLEHREKDKLGFSYTDSNGALTNRQIRTKAFVPWLDNDHLVLGFCNYRKANRSFVTSRMDDVFDLETGECIDDIDRYLTEIYEKSDYKKIDEFIDERMSVVECLLYLAKLDGNLTTAQKSLIISYIAETSGVAIVTDSVASKLIKDFAEDLTPQEFRKLLSQIRREQPENLAALRDLGPKVVGARRNGAGGGQTCSLVYEKQCDLR